MNQHTVRWVPARVAALVAVVIGAGVTGCSLLSNSSEPEVIPGDPASTLAYAKAQGWDDVVGWLADGEVTSEENLASHMAWRKCREELGFSFGATELDAVNGKFYQEREEYLGAGAPDETKNLLCYSRYSDMAELVYQSTAPSQMNPELLAAVQTCLDDAGYVRPNDGTETHLKDFYPVGEMWELGDPVHKCVEENYWRLFPDSLGLGYGFTLAD